MPEYKKKKVNVFYKREPGAHMVKVVDEGKGFEWKKFMKVDPARATDNHGRGIAQANMVSFDRIKYNDKGNEVILVVDIKNNNKPLDW